MRRISAVLASACAALALAGAASSTTFGVADDAGKYAEDGGSGFFNMLTELGMTENRMAVFWDPANPTTIFDQAFLDRSVPQAMRRGIDVIFAIYPLKARALVDTPNGVRQFADYAAKVAERYPYVRKIVCLNEGNQPRFHQPQFDDAGNGISGIVQEQAMAACYDAVKAVDPGIDVIAFGLSPRGNDDFDAASNVSHSPIRFLKEAGDGPFVRIFVDEVGYQARVAPGKSSLYTGAENVTLVDEATQGAYYAQLIALMACDPNVALLNFFHAVDETSLPAWQSGVVLPDGTRRVSYATVKEAIGANQQCQGKEMQWRHTERVVGARVIFKTLPRSFVVRADEGFSYEVKITRPSSTRRLTGADGQGDAARDLLFKLPRLRSGTYQVKITLRAETNPTRATTFTRTFRG